MSWQDDLRRLDADLAAGRIEPSVHRKQRDELLAAASGSTVPSPVPSPLRRPGNRSWQSANPAYDRPAGPTPAPVVPPQATGPRPPTPQDRPWMRSAPSAAKPGGIPGIPELPDHMTTAPSPADIVPTRYLRVDGPNQQHATPSRFPPVAGGAGPAEPPLPEPEGAGRHRWQTDPAGEEEPSRGVPAWLFITLAVVLVVGLVAGGIYWFGKKDAAPSDVASPPPASSSAPPQTNGVVDPSLTLEQRLPALPGKANPADSTMSIDKALEAKVITEADAKQIRANNGKEVVFRASSDPAKPRDGNLLMAIPTLSVYDAKHLVTGLRQNLSGARLAATRLGPTEDDLMYTQRGTDGWVGILWYASGAVVVGIGVSQSGTADSAPLRSRLEAIRNTVTTVLPPG
ncbi:hypothetical protein [Amycolatopsis sp. NPDC051716]|jgi:hypothetical protein|uniref:hypothetical protein n=1 Tax=Amycolatopsis sp. NPDC051716 TaxID=3155804 RepID=UPI00343A3F8E